MRFEFGIEVPWPQWFWVHWHVSRLDGGHKRLGACDASWHFVIQIGPLDFTFYRP